MEIGFVVVEFNQASGRPELGAFPWLADDRADAQERRDLLEAENRKAGRRERFAVGIVTVDEEDL